MKNLQTALLAISVASGYHYTLAAGAVKIDPDANIEALIAPGGPRPFALIELSDKESWNYNYGADQVKLTIPTTINWVHDFDPTNDDSLLKTFLRGCADVERAIGVDVVPPPLAGLGTIKITNRQPAFVGSQVWALIETEIAVHRTFGRPNG